VADIKDELSPTTIASLGADLRRVWPEFPVERFRALAVDGLEGLRLWERVGSIARALVECMPREFAAAADVIERALGSETFTGWATLPVGSFVTIAGIDEPAAALPVLAALTPRFSSEFSIRAFVERQPGVTFEHLHRWVTDTDEHVRRLVSEGTRPRLPWAPVLRGLVADPTPTIELLDELFDDDSEYVRRSVSNHLNDISKDHPGLALDVAARWAARSTHGDRVVRHALRTMIKKGDPQALALLGYGASDGLELLELDVQPAQITIGESVVARFTIVASSDTRAVIDYLVHYQGARGRKAGKVFKLTERSLRAGEPVAIERQHRFEHVSIRRILPGTHRIEIQANGRVLGGAEFEVVAREL
jgi:3-methyladenine DNA glycosylase AlkC